MPSIKITVNSATPTRDYLAVNDIIDFIQKASGSCLNLRRWWIVCIPWNVIEKGIWRAGKANFSTPLGMGHSHHAYFYYGPCLRVQDLPYVCGYRARNSVNYISAGLTEKEPCREARRFRYNKYVKDSTLEKHLLSDVNSLRIEVDMIDIERSMYTN